MTIDSLLIEGITIFLFVLLLGVGIIIGYSRSLFAAVMLSGIFSLLSAGLFVVMDAVDVAFTEACSWCWNFNRIDDDNPLANN